MRTYMLIEGLPINSSVIDLDRFWYGYFDKDRFYWSDWCRNCAEALTTSLALDIDSDETAEEFLAATNAPIKILYKGNKPITKKLYPEYYV